MAIIACVLFTCFEMLHDSCNAAISHIRYGLMIVEQFICSHDTLPESSAGKGKARAASPSPFVLDEEILNVFQRLEYLVWAARLVKQSHLSSRVRSIWLSYEMPRQHHHRRQDLIEDPTSVSQLDRLGEAMR